MKDIGQDFKDAREFIGICIEEAATDMEVTVAQLENLEDGNANAFKDVFFLKDLIKKYAKYLNLDEDKLIEEYNEFMFNFTSKIPISEIEKKVEIIKKEEAKDSPKKIASPYTKTKVKEDRNPKTYIYAIIGVVVIILSVLIVILVKNEVTKNDFVGINILGGFIYEFTK